MPLDATQSHQLLARATNLWYAGDTGRLAIDLGIAGLVTTPSATPPSVDGPDGMPEL